MKPHSRETIGQLRSISEQLPEEVYNLGDLSVEYAVMNIPEEQRPFPMAVAAAFPKRSERDGDKQRGVILVSDDVPERLRGPWAMHEYIDFAVLGHQAVDRCQTSESKILDLLEADGQMDIAVEFAMHRPDFFLNVSGYMRQLIASNGSSKPYGRNDIDGAFGTSYFVKQWLEQAPSALIPKTPSPEQLTRLEQGPGLVTKPVDLFTIREVGGNINNFRGHFMESSPLHKGDRPYVERFRILYPELYEQAIEAAKDNQWEGTPEVKRVLIDAYCMMAPLVDESDPNVFWEPGVIDRFYLCR